MIFELFSKYAWVVPLKDKRGISIVNAFQKIISKRKPNKILVDQGGEFYNKLFKRFLKISNIEIQKYIQHTMKENLLLLIQYTMKENLLLLRDSLGRFLST